MEITGSASEDAAAGLGPTRRRVLAVLQDAAGPMTVQQVADRLGLHPNSVRFHLDALATGEADAAVVRDREPRGTPGRPRVTYAATSAAPGVAPRRYQELAGMLAAFIEAEVDDPATIAERLGRAWSGSLPPREEPLGALVAGLGEVGFGSRVVEDGDGPRVEVTHCPFLEVAADHEDVVCGLHLGLMRGVLEQAGSDWAVADLQPLVEPGLCVARLDGSASPSG